MGCNRTPTEREAEQIHEAASRVASETGGDVARAEMYVALYGEIAARSMLAREEQERHQAFSGFVASASEIYSFERPAWESASTWGSAPAASSWQPTSDWSTPASSSSSFVDSSAQTPFSPRAAESPSWSQPATSVSWGGTSPSAQQTPMSSPVETPFSSSSERASEPSPSPSQPTLVPAPPETPRSVSIDRGVDFSEVQVLRGNIPPDTRAFNQNHLLLGTDVEGRPVTAQSWLGTGPGGARSSHEKESQRAAANYQTGIDGTHLLARMFGIPDVPENLIAFPAEVNQGQMKTFEAAIAGRIASGERLFGQAFACYEGPGQKMPYAVLIVVYGVDGNEVTREMFTPDGYAT